MIFNSLEPIADSAHILSVINNAMDQIEALSPDNYIDEDGKEISLSGYDIHFEQVKFSYDKGDEKRNVIEDVSFWIKESFAEKAGADHRRARLRKAGMGMS